MPKPENVVPHQFGKKGEEIEKEQRLKAGKNSGASRRAKRDFRQCVKEVLENQVNLQPKSAKKIEQVGIDPNEPMTVREAAAAQLAFNSINGDEQSTKLLMTYAGETTEAEIAKLELRQMKAAAAASEGGKAASYSAERMRKFLGKLTDEQLDQYEALCRIFWEDDGNA